MSQTNPETREEILQKLYLENIAFIRKINAEEIEAINAIIEGLRSQRECKEKARDEMLKRENKVMPYYEDWDLGLQATCNISGGRKRRHFIKQTKQKKHSTRHNKRRRSKTSKKY